MSYSLLIVESPAKCQKIESYLGSGYKCIASYGHIQELPGMKNIDVDNNFKPSFQPMESKTQQISKIRTMIKNAKEVLLVSLEKEVSLASFENNETVFDVPIHVIRPSWGKLTQFAVSISPCAPRPWSWLRLTAGRW